MSEDWKVTVDDNGAERLALRGIKRGDTVGVFRQADGGQVVVVTLGTSTADVDWVAIRATVDGAAKGPADTLPLADGGGGGAPGIKVDGPHFGVPLPPVDLSGPVVRLPDGTIGRLVTRSEGHTAPTPEFRLGALTIEWIGEGPPPEGIGPSSGDVLVVGEGRRR